MTNGMDQYLRRGRRHAYFNTEFRFIIIIIIVSPLFFLLLRYVFIRKRYANNNGGPVHGEHFKRIITFRRRRRTFRKLKKNIKRKIIRFSCHTSEDRRHIYTYIHLRTVNWKKVRNVRGIRCRLYWSTSG